MKILINLLLALVVLACTDKAIAPESEQEEVLATTTFELDTIIEKNDPGNLDLSQHQLFIDTAHTSRFYSIIKNWEIDARKEASVGKSISNYSARSLFKNKFPLDFPREWIKIRKYNGEYLLYERSDGTDTRYEIRDSVVICYLVHESLVTPINEIKKADENGVTLVVATPFSKDTADSSEGTFTIEKTIEENIYKVTFQSEVFELVDYIVSKDVIDNYDLLVNKSPTVRVLEFGEFEEIDLPLIGVKNQKHSIGNSSLPESGTYDYDIVFAEWDGKFLGDKVKVIIEGDKVQVVYMEGTIAGLKKGDMVDEGFLMQHKSGVWIIATDKSSVHLAEVGGCTGGPATIDFLNKKYVMC